METPILGLMSPKKSTALYNGFTTPFYEMDGPTWHQISNVFAQFSKMGRLWNDPGFSNQGGCKNRV